MILYSAVAVSVRLLAIAVVCCLPLADNIRLLNLACAQSSSSSAVSLRERKKLSDSSVGFDLTFVTPDRNGGVWLTGSALQVRGLLVNYGESFKAVTVQGISRAAEPFFVTRDIGWMTNYRFLYRTIDGGGSWTKVDLPGEIFVRSLFFSDVQNGWIGGLKGEIYRTTDGGQSWRKHQTALDYRIHQLVFVDGLHGWANAYVYDPTSGRRSALLRTTDGGENWELLSNVEADSAQSLYRIAFVSREEGWGIDGRFYSIVHTVDGGKTWTIQRERKDRGWNSIVFLNQKEGWASGQDGIIHTADGGDSWENQFDKDSPKPGYLNQIAFIDSKQGWVAGTGGALRTTNGGRTWKLVSDDWRLMIPTVESLLKETALNLDKH